MASQSDRSFWAFNAVVSTTAVGFLGWLLLLREGGGAEADLSFMPAVNAALNATSATLLVLGFAAIRSGRRDIHDTQYQGVGAVRVAYFAILISHVLLSIVMLPMILTTFYLATRERFVAHRRLARWTLPIWLYVSVTGVVIYFMLRP